VDEGQARIWCLFGRKAGDNTQVRALADELGVGYQDKHIAARPWGLLTHLTLQTTLAGIDLSESSPLVAPWPDLVISAGRRNEPVARWIQKQSGGRTRLVHIGRPWAPLHCYDLIITTPQYFLPELPNTLHNSLPLHRVSAAHLRAEGEHLLPLIDHLPRPRIAVLVGGDSGRFVDDAAQGPAAWPVGQSVGTGRRGFITGARSRPYTHRRWRCHAGTIAGPASLSSLGARPGQPLPGRIGAGRCFCGHG